MRALIAVMTIGLINHADAAPEKVDLVGMKVTWHGKTITPTKPRALVPRLDVPQIQPYRAGWKATVELQVDALGGVYPEQFEVALDVGQPGRLLSASISKVDFFDTRSTDKASPTHAISAATIRATLDLSGVPSEGCVELVATIQPLGVRTFPLRLCLTSLLTTPSKRTYKMIRWSDHFAADDEIHLAVKDTTSLATLRAIEMATRGKLIRHPSDGDLISLTLRLSPPARTTRDMFERIERVKQLVPAAHATPGNEIKLAEPLPEAPID